MMSGWKCQICFFSPRTNLAPRRSRRYVDAFYNKSTQNLIGISMHMINVCQVFWKGFQSEWFPIFMRFETSFLKTLKSGTQLQEHNWRSRRSIQMETLIRTGALSSFEHGKTRLQVLIISIWTHMPLLTLDSSGRKHLQSFNSFQRFGMVF